MAGFTVNPQRFVVVEQMSDGLLDGDVSGIMGLAFEALASTQATPFWQALVNGNQFNSPDISFWLARHLDDVNAAVEEDGGVMTLGGTNSSLFTGDIEFNSLVNDGTPTFWMLEMTGEQSRKLSWCCLTPSRRHCGGKVCLGPHWCFCALRNRHGHHSHRRPFRRSTSYIQSNRRCAATRWADAGLLRVP